MIKQFGFFSKDHWRKHSNVTECNKLCSQFRSSSYVSLRYKPPHGNTESKAHVAVYCPLHLNTKQTEEAVLILPTFI